MAYGSGSGGGYSIDTPVMYAVAIGQVDAGRAMPGTGVAGPSVPLGTLVRALDPVWGEGEFIFLAGVASTVVGSMVQFLNGGVDANNNPKYATTLAPATSNLGQALAVATAATVANTWGWYQLAGFGIIATNGTLAAANANVYLAGSGQVTGTAAASKQVLNVISASATGTPAANQALAYLNYPMAQGAIT